MSSESDVTRRDFLKTAAKTTASASAWSGITFLTRPERVFGANDRVRVAVCGLKNRGKDHLDAFARVPNVEIAALCDVDEAVSTSAVRRSAAARERLWTSAGYSRINPSMRFRSRRPIIGMR